MRRTAAALVTVALAAGLLTGPLASTGAAGASVIECAAEPAAPACALLDDLAAQLGPLQPVLSLAGPVMAQLTPAVQGLATRADQPSGVPAAEVTTQAQALLDQLDALPSPVRELLAVAALDGLVTTLEDLVAELAAPLAGDQGGAETSPPTPAPRSTTAPTSATSSGPPTLGGSFDSSAPAASSSPAVPPVPVGDPLTLAPLALPTFASERSLGRAPFEPAAPAAPTEVRLDAAAAAARLPDGTSGADIVVVIVLSLLLLGAAVVAQAHQNRRTIPD